MQCGPDDSSCDLARLCYRANKINKLFSTFVWIRGMRLLYAPISHLPFYMHTHQYAHTLTSKFLHQC